jgi:hypothetical protein
VTCNTCSITPGTQVVQVDYDVECAPAFYRHECIVDTFFVSLAQVEHDPWNLADTTSAAGGDSMTVTFTPGCGTPDCSAILLEQTSRLRVLGSPTDSTCIPVSSRRYPFSGAEQDKIAQTMTAGCTRVDQWPSDVDPFMNGNDPSDAGHQGRSGANPAAAYFGDAPDIVAAGDTILVEYEVNAFCYGGTNKGRFLGRTFWIFKVPPGEAGVATVDPRRSGDLGEPSFEFLQADTLFRRQRGLFRQPPESPVKGGRSCQ